LFTTLDEKDTAEGHVERWADCSDSKQGCQGGNGVIP
jgi:hypothetical protein